MVLVPKEGYQPPAPPPPPPDNGGRGFKPGGGTIARTAGDVVRDQIDRVGRFARSLRPFKYSLTTAKPATAPKEEQSPGTAIQVLVVQGGLIPDDARISVGGSEFFPLLDGWVYETEEPFDGFSVYWPTAAAGVDVWILVAYGRIMQLVKR